MGIIIASHPQTPSDDGKRETQPKQWKTVGVTRPFGNLYHGRPCPQAQASSLNHWRLIKMGLGNMNDVA